MHYTINYQSAIIGGTIPLTYVAESMARHAASAYGKSSLHGPTLENTRPACIELLLDAANKGALTVCDNTGRTACAADLVSATVLPDVQEGFSSSERAILALYVRAKHLCDWGGTNGYEFELVDVPAQEIVFDLKDENGKVIKKDYFRGYVGIGTSMPLARPAANLTASSLQAALVSEPATQVAPIHPNAPKNDDAKARGGRPKVNHKKADILRRLIAVMTAEEKCDPGQLPGSAADLLDACKRIERTQTNKTAMFGRANAEAFNTWLRATEYRIKIGRTRNDEKTYWTDLCVKTMGKIRPDIFS
jgi:hypothetical protein